MNIELLLENKHHSVGGDFLEISGGQISVVEFGVDFRQLRIIAGEV